MYIIICRAKVTPECFDGKPTATQFFGEDLPMDEDGTWQRDGEGETIICDPCYVALMPLTPSGKGLTHELPAAIAAVRQGQG